MDNEDEGAKVHHNQQGIRLSAILDVDRERDCSFCRYPQELPWSPVIGLFFADQRAIRGIFEA